jgi:hypothetical protein
LQTRQQPSGGRWMPLATARCQDATLVQFSRDCALDSDATRVAVLISHLHIL